MTERLDRLGPGRLGKHQAAIAVKLLELPFEKLLKYVVLDLPSSVALDEVGGNERQAACAHRARLLCGELVCIRGGDGVDEQDFIVTVAGAVLGPAPLELFQDDPPLVGDVIPVVGQTLLPFLERIGCALDGDGNRRFRYDESSLQGANAGHADGYGLDAVDVGNRRPRGNGRIDDVTPHGRPSSRLRSEYGPFDGLEERVGELIRVGGVNLSYQKPALAQPLQAVVEHGDHFVG